MSRLDELRNAAQQRMQAGQATATTRADAPPSPPLAGVSRQQGRIAELKAQARARQDNERSFGQSAAEFGGQINVGMARALGLGNQGRADVFQGLMNRAGMAPPVGTDVDTTAGAAGRMVGQSLPFALPAVGMVPRAAAVARGAAPAATTLGRIGESLGATMLRSPGTAAALEVSSAASAGAAGHVAAEMFPDSPSTQAIAEIVGGFAPAAAAGAAVAIPKVVQNFPVVNFARQMVVPTKGPSTTRARTRVQSVARDPEAARRALDAGGRDLSPDVTLTPAQQAGDVGLLSLERSVMSEGARDSQLTQAIRQSKAAARRIGRPEVRPEDAQDTLREARGYLKVLLDERARIAGEKARQRIDAIGPTISRQDANRVAREELDKALVAARRQESELWQAIPNDIQIETPPLRQRFQEIAAETPRALQDSIPAKARQFLAGKGGFADVETVRELHGFRSAMLSEARAARSGISPDRDRARIADRLAAATLDLLSDSAVGTRMTMARDFSRDLNDRFTRGAVGRLMGSDAAGGLRTPPEATLERTVGRAGPDALTETQALLRAVERSGDQPGMTRAIDEFLRDDFVRKAMPGGNLDVNKAAAFMRRHQDVLSTRPELAAELRGAIDGGNTAARALERSTRVTKGLADPKISRAAVFIEAPPDRAIQAIRNARHPGRVAQELVRQARRDPTGDAIGGLKAAFVEDLMKGATTTSNRTEAGEALTSGFALRDALREPKNRAIAREVLTGEEMDRLTKLATSLVRIEQSMAAAPASGGVIDDAVGASKSFLARVTGARLAARLNPSGRATVQIPAEGAKLVQRVTSWLANDPARREITDGFQDPKLLRALLAPMDTPGRRAMVEKQINAWLVSIGVDDIDDLTEEPPE